MTRIVAFSDVHLGAGAEHRCDHLADAEAVLDQIADLAIARHADVVLNAGDTFHRAKPEPPALHVFKRFCERLATEGIPMVALGGNGLHEAPMGQRSALELFESRYVRVSRTPEVITEFGGVAICTLPAVSLARLAAARNDGDRAELAEEAIDLLIKAARDLYAEAPDGRPRILLAHQMVTGASLPTGLPVEQVGSTVLPLWALEEIGYDAIVLGDIHKAQVLNEAPFVAYCGSPQICDFGEQANEPGVWILDTDEVPEMTGEFVRLDDRRFVTVDVDLGPGAVLRVPGDSLADITDEADVIAAAIAEHFPLTDAVVRVRYRATEEQHRRVDQPALLRLLDDAGVHRLYGGLAWEPVRATRTRAAEVDETLAPLAALELWLGTQEGVAEESAEGLRELLGEWVTSGP